ncbi:anhydro-N-acetylmuramic acid kinase [Echinicola sediminis]
MADSHTYHILGLMSGTSGDGLDMAYARLVFDGQWSFTMLNATTMEFPLDLGARLSKAHLLSGEQLCLLDREFGTWMGQCVKIFCEKEGLSPDAVASHGHTVFHQPQKRLTTQIGCGWSLMQASGLAVINDFRTRDVLLGGQGAPLVPIGDHFLFPEYNLCLNLGGISNISMVTKGQRVAFDISPFNLLLNHFASKKGLAYDNGGQLARSGKVNALLLEKLNSLPFYTQQGAKSLGREDIETVFLPLLEQENDTSENILATLIAHYSFQIAKVCLAYEQSPDSKLLITGGGAYNDYFVEQLSALLVGKIETVVPEPEIVEFKEALIFAFLGALKLRNEVNTMASVTGASRDSCGGTLYMP